MSGKTKKKFGDRKDAKLIKKLDSMHFIMPIIFPNRCDNEAYINECIDLTNLSEYLQKKNVEGITYKYNVFQVIVTAVLKTVTLRPKMNRFIANSNLYERNKISASFVIKKIFNDNSEEGLAIIKAEPDDTIDTIHEKIYKQVSYCRKDNKKDSTTNVMDFFNKLPRFISKNAVKFVRFLDRFGKVPKAFIATDPYYQTVILSNLGSIKLHAGYHHLTNWGTTSMFVVVGERKLRPFYDDDGNVTMRDSIDLGLTIDERIADGYYYSKTIALLKKLLENPQLLENKLNDEVEY